MEYIIENRELLFEIISLFGLLLDIVGVIWLFYLKDIYFKKIRRGLRLDNYSIDRNIKNIHLGNAIIRKITSEINKTFDQISEQNEITRKKSNIALLIILLGFLMQSLVYLFRIFC